jgi:serine protease Do
MIAAASLTVAAWQPWAQAEEPAEGVAQAQGLSRAFRSAAHKVLPTVVTIKTTTKARRIERGENSLHGRNPFKGTPFEDFFGGGDDSEGTGIIPRQMGVGSGVIIDPSGIILTNYHVVDDADEVLVELSDGRSLKASNIKTDEETDLAVLRVKSEEKLPAAKLGDSSKMEIGDWVIAIGSPFELEHTVSAGIISGMKRVLPSGRRAEYLQTDAAINPGNSGGPLVNLDGEVIGINTAIASNNGGYQGIGFAIPSNLAKWVTDQLIARGSVQRAYLGVAIAELTSDLAEKMGVRRDAGVLVSDVRPDTPASKAGLQDGDIIAAFGGVAVRTPHDLQALVERSPLGSRQQLTVLRDKQTLNLTVEVQGMPKDFTLGSRNPHRRLQLNDDSGFASKELGLEVGELTAETAQQLGYEGHSGVVITDVSPDSPAAEASLHPGMLILRVGRKPIKTVDDFRQAVKHESLTEGVMLLVRVGEANRFVVLQKK